VHIEDAEYGNVDVVDEEHVMMMMTMMWMSLMQCRGT